MDKYAETLAVSEKEFFLAMDEENEKWVIDVRKKEDYERYHLPDAINIDLLCTYAVDRLTLLEKDKPVFLYCYSGIRSRGALPLFKELGFTKIYHLTKGINACKVH